MPNKNDHSLDFDLSVLAKFIYALNIIRRQVLAYPSGHPIISQAAHNLTGILPRLLEFKDDITIGIARDTLVVGRHTLDSNDPVFNDLAKSLFSANLVSVTINKNLTADEVCLFFEMFRKQADQPLDGGEFKCMLTDMNLQGIDIQGIDFSAFKATEMETVLSPKTKFVETNSVALWKSFIDGLLNGNLDISGDKLNPLQTINPDLLAEILNQDNYTEELNIANSYEKAITKFLMQADQDKLRTRAFCNTLGRLGEMVDKLKPELRRKFLNSTLTASRYHEEAAELMLGKMSPATLLDALEQLDAQALEIPQTLIDIIGKLAGQKDAGDEGPQSKVFGSSPLTSKETAEQLSVLFGPDHTQSFVPEDYQDSLSALVTANPESVLDQGQIAELLNTLDGHIFEQQFLQVILNLLRRVTDQETFDAISENIDYLRDYFLEVGDFVSLEKTYSLLNEKTQSGIQRAQGTENKILAATINEEHVDKVLNGLHTWGKPAHSSIKTLISSVGLPFVEPLLDRLAEEEDMSHRRLFIDCLQLLGPVAREGVVARLQDQRWYFVRNLVIILRNLNDPSVLVPLGRLVGSANPKVQYEVMQTFLTYQDPRAERFLLQELDSKQPDRLLNAIKLAAMSKEPTVAKKMAQLLNAKLPHGHEELLKSNVIHSLKETSTNDCLPALSKFLLNRSLLDKGRSSSLKIKAIGLLKNFPQSDAEEIAERVIRDSSGELARTAVQVLQQLKG